MRRLAAVGVIAVVIATAEAGASAGEKRWPTPRTVATVGHVGAFAHDRDWVAWADGESAPCPARIRVRHLRTGTTHALNRRAPRRCDGVGDPLVQNQMALAGTRALWGIIQPYTDEHAISVVTAAPRSPERVVTVVQALGGRREETGRMVPVPMAGDGNALVFADISNNWEDGPAEPRGVIRVVGRTAAAIPGSEGAYAVAVAGDSIAYAQSAASGCACDRVAGASWRTGKPTWRFELPPGNRVRALAIDGSRVVLLLGSRLEVRQLGGHLVRTIPVSRAAADIDLAGTRLVYRATRAIRLVDVGSGSTSTLAVARGSVAGLSIEGRRVIWVEDTARGARILEVLLPRG
jgi:hypothetical protein